MQATTCSHGPKADVGKRTLAVLGIAASVMLMHQNVEAVTTSTVDLGTAGDFAILAGSEITDAGGASVIVTGDVGLSPATGANIGLTSAQVIGGTIYSVDAFGPVGSVENPGLLTTAKDNLTTAYNDAGARTADVAFGDVDNQLGGQTLIPGVYSFGHAATANLIGELTLDPDGDPDPVWIFQASSDLVTASDSFVTLLGDATSCDVFWWVGSSATIGTGTDFVGNIMGDQSIALQTNATLEGSALARIAAVTLDHNTITHLDCTTTDGGNGGSAVPDGGTTLLMLCSGLMLLAGCKRYLAPLELKDPESRAQSGS